VLVFQKKKIYYDVVIFSKDIMLKTWVIRIIYHFLSSQEIATSLSQLSTSNKQKEMEMSPEDDPEAWKRVIQKRIWDLMKAQNSTRNPRLVHHRILNFVGASVLFYLSLFFKCVLCFRVVSCPSSFFLNVTEGKEENPKTIDTVPLWPLLFNPL
jgi:hypothetical protein